jgi:hypothetical protein
MFKLYKCWPRMPDPLLPTADLQGEIPARALKFCEPFLVANAAGVLLCPPINMTLTWTGSEVLADLDGIDETILVDRLYLPDYAEYWKKIAPAEAQNVLPPFLEAFPERGAVQIWTGMFAVTNPGISTWVRGPVNRNNGSAYAVTEGVVDTDWWTGPLFFVLQIQKTDFPITFRQDTPFIQIIPVPRAAIQCGKPDASAALVEDAAAPFWSGLVATAVRRNRENPGSYRRESRRRLRESGDDRSGSESEMRPF